MFRQMPSEGFAVMIRLSPTRRRGYTLMELLVVIAILLVLGAILAPTFRSLSGNTKTKAAADVVRGRLADARAYAVEQGRAYRVSVSPDGNRVRVTPVTEVDPSDPMVTPYFSQDDLPDQVSAALASFDPESGMLMTDPDGWVWVATFLPDGTTREDGAAVRVSEPGVQPYMVRVRGMTGVTDVVPDVQPTTGATP